MVVNTPFLREDRPPLDSTWSVIFFFQNLTHLENQLPKNNVHQLYVPLKTSNPVALKKMVKKYGTKNGFPGMFLSVRGRSLHVRNVVGLFSCADVTWAHLSREGVTQKMMDLVLST